MNYPRVSTILQHFGIIDTRWYATDACRRGTAVHEAAARIAMGQEIPRDWLERHPEIAPFIDALLEFLTAERVKVVGTEVEVVNEAEKYVGHVDWKVDTSQCRAGGLTLPPYAPLELKSGGECPWVDLQTAFYAMAMGTRTRFALRLKSNGRPQVVRLEEYRDFAEATLYARTYHALVARGAIRE